MRGKHSDTRRDKYGHAYNNAHTRNIALLNLHAHSHGKFYSKQDSHPDCDADSRLDCQCDNYKYGYSHDERD